MDTSTNQDTILIKDLIAKLLNKWYWFLISGLIIMPITYTYIRTLQNVYQVKASILLSEKGRESYASEKFMKEIGLFVPQTGVDDEIGILSSYNLVKKTIEQLDFGISYYHTHTLKTQQTYHYSPFKVVVDSSHVQVEGAKFFVDILDDESYEIYAEEKSAYVVDLKLDESLHKLKPYIFRQKWKFGEPYTDQNLSFTLIRDTSFTKLAPGKYYFKIHTLSSLADDYQGVLAVAATSKESRLLELTSEGKIVAMQNQFLDKLLEVYIQEDLKKQSRLGERTLDLIDEQLLGITDSLKEAEYSLKAFRANSNIVNISETASDLSRQLTELETKRAQLSVQAQYYEYVRKDVAAGAGMTDIVAPATMGVQDPLLSNLLIGLATLKQERSSKRTNLKEGNPQLKMIDGKIADAHATILKNVNSSISANNMALGDVNTRINAIKSSIARLPESERRLTNIERQFGQSDNMYKYLLQKRAEAAIALATNTVNKYVVDESRQVGKEPIAPKKGVIYVLALLLSLGIPLGLIMLFNFFDEKIGGDQDIGSSTNIPILGYIAEYDKHNSYIIEKDSRTSFAESFRSLRIKMLYMVEGGDKKVIGLTSSSSGEGKTFCATNLAATLAHAGKKTLLIDTDLRRPKVHTYFQTQHSFGLSDYLSGESDYINEVIHHTHIENLHIIPAGNLSNNPTDLISNSFMEELVEACQDEYDHIIFDTPPIGLVSDYLVLMHLTDYNIYVVRHKVTETDDLKLINELYDSEKIKQIGLLINGVASLKDYGYLNTDYGINGYRKGKKNRFKYKRQIS